MLLAGRTDATDPDGRMAKDTLGVVVFRAPDRAAAEALMAADTAVRAGAMRAKLHATRERIRTGAPHEHGRDYASSPSSGRPFPEEPGRLL